MTQPEDDAARLAREIADAAVPHLITDKGKQDLYPLAGIDVGRFAAAIETKLRAHLAERDARERMVREAAEAAFKAMKMTWDAYIKGVPISDNEGRTEAVAHLACAMRDMSKVVALIQHNAGESLSSDQWTAALSAKSDEQTGEANG